MILLSHGKKTSRYYVNPDIQSMICTFTDHAFIPEPANGRDYIDNSVYRLKKSIEVFDHKDEKAKAYVLDREGIFTGKVENDGIEVQQVNTLEDLIKDLKARVKSKDAI